MVLPSTSFPALGTGSGPAVLINIHYMGNSQDMSQTETGHTGPSCKLLTDGQRPGIDLGAVQFPGAGA